MPYDLISHRNALRKITSITLPQLSSLMLSYETGFSIADGGLYYRRRKASTDYCVYYYGHIYDELPFFEKVIIPILKDLYGISARVTKRPEKGLCQIVIYSKGLFTFKHEVIGLPVGFGNKIEKMPVSLISQGEEQLIELISGLFDGEASLTFLKRGSEVRYYPRIKFEMSNRGLVHEVAHSLRNLEINVTNVYERRKLDKRTRHTYVTWYFNVNGKENCSELFNILHLRNPKHIEKYKFWKKHESPSR